MKRGTPEFNNERIRLRISAPELEARLKDLEEAKKPVVSKVTEHLEFFIPAKTKSGDDCKKCVALGKLCKTHG